MRIENNLPNFYTNIIPITANRAFMPAEPQVKNAYYEPGIVVEISQQAKDSLAAMEIMGMEGCQTCKDRKYVDQSSDSSVSYQSPTHISPEQSASKVMSHEREHISNDRAKAEQEDRKVISQTVSLATSLCPECGKMYVSGGSARTVTAAKNNETSQTEENNTTGETNV